MWISDLLDLKLIQIKTLKLNKLSQHLNSIKADWPMEQYGVKEM